MDETAVLQWCIWSLLLNRRRNDDAQVGASAYDYMARRKLNLVITESCEPQYETHSNVGRGESLQRPSPSSPGYDAVCQRHDGGDAVWSSQTGKPGLPSTHLLRGRAQSCQSHRPAHLRVFFDCKLGGCRSDSTVLPGLQRLICYMVLVLLA